jgi:hypothetical protein
VYNTCATAASKIYARAYNIGSDHRTTTTSIAASQGIAALYE